MKTCPVCKREFKPWKSIQECCSQKCAAVVATKPSATKTCPICQHDFTGPACWIKRQTYCSKKCVGAAKKLLGTHGMCESCGDDFYRPASWPNPRFCSSKCARAGLQKFALNESALDVLSPLIAYVLGWLASDGCVETSTRPVLSWQLKDTEPFKAIRLAFGTDKKIETCHRRHGTFFRLRICSDKLVRKAMELGIGPRKSKTLQMPSIPQDVMPHFIRGVFEGDGHVNISRGSKTNRPEYKALYADISSASDEFLNGLTSFLKRLGITGHTRLYNGQTGRVQLKCGEALKFLAYIYADSKGMRLARKYRIYQEAVRLGLRYDLRKPKSPPHRPHRSQLALFR